MSDDRNTPPPASRPAAEPGPPPRPRGGFERRLRFLLSFAGAVAAVVVFAWASQARQDEAIRGNSTAVAVIETRLEAICEKLDDIRAILVREFKRVKTAPAADAAGRLSGPAERPVREGTGAYQ